MRTSTTLFVLAVSSLVALGMVMIYSAGNVHKAGGAYYFTAQLVAFGIGLTVCLVMACLDYRWWKGLSWLPYVATIVLLILVLQTPEVNGARRWFKLWRGFSFQPSELAKIGLIFLLAWYAERMRPRMGEFVRGFVVPGLLVALPVGLVVVEPDVGTALLLSVVAALILVLAGVRWRFGLPVVLVGLVVLGYFLIHNGVRSKRLYAWFHPEETRRGVGMQAWEARVAFGGGGWAGRGLGSSRQKLGFVSEHHTDYILPIIGEELGLPATLGVVACYMLIVFSGFWISARAPDFYGFLLGSGITLLVAIQACVNIAVVTSVLPSKGLPLPFISYGGSNLILMLGCAGILLSIARHATESESEVTEDELPGRTAASAMIA